MRFFGSSNVFHSVKRHVERRTDLSGRIVIDLPAGHGNMSAILRKLGARVEAYDLFPEFFEIPDMVCQKADLTKKTSIPDGHADLVLCQEGIEHISDQLATLKELSRILKHKGRLIVTTPNISHLRAKLSNFLVESEHFRRMPANEADQILTASWDSNVHLFGHVFLIGAQRLRTLARLAGLRLVKTHPVRISNFSLLLGISFPLLVLVNILLYFDIKRKTSKEEWALRKGTFREVIRLNLNFYVLFGKSLIFEFEKIGAVDEWGV